MVIKIQLMREGARMPSKKHNDDAGWDLYSPTDLTIRAGERVAIPTGVCLEIPKGYFGEVKDRSSIALQGIYTGGGVVDAGYRGEVSVLLRNSSAGDYDIDEGDRIAQLLILPVPKVKMKLVKKLVKKLSVTSRGVGGFGSSGR